MTTLEVKCTESGMYGQISRQIKPLLGSEFKASMVDLGYKDGKIDHNSILSLTLRIVLLKTRPIFIREGFIRKTTRKELIQEPDPEKTIDLKCFEEQGRVTVVSNDPIMDELARKVGIETSHTFQVELYLASYSEEMLHGIKCKYCGQYSRNVEKCDYCGAVPV